MIIIDTSVAIALRDVDMETHERVAHLGQVPSISIVTRIELENGVNREPAGVDRRRRLLDRLLETLSIEMFTPADIQAYGKIVRDRATRVGKPLIV